MASYVQLGQSGKVYRDPPQKKPPKKKKSNTQFAYILIALVLVLGIGAMAGTMIWLSSVDRAPANSELSIDVRPSGTHTTAARPAAGSSADAASADNSQTTVPRTTSAPTVHYVKGTSGSFAGSDDYKVKLIAEYGLVKAENGSEKLNLRVYLQSFSLSLGESRGTITANGKNIAFRTDKLTLEQNSRQKTLLTEQQLDVTQKEITVDIRWHMGITYSGAEVDDLTVSGVITLP